MDSLDAVIGRLYISLANAEQDKANLVQILALVKDGTIDLSRVEVTSSGVTILPENAE